jgi:hypothetical protein
MALGLRASLGPERIRLRPSFTLAGLRPMQGLGYGLQP